MTGAAAMLLVSTLAGPGWPTTGVFSQSADVIVAIRVHGNVLTPEAEVLRLAAVRVGDPFTPQTADQIAARVRAGGPFQEVTVLKRFASIADPHQVLVVIVVNEGAVRLDVPDAPTQPIGVVRRGGLRALMWMPILTAEDGHGLTYGVRVAATGKDRRPSRLSAPLTWGGTKQAGLEFDRPFTAGPLGRVVVAAGLQRQQHPAVRQDDDRRFVRMRVERSSGPVLVLGRAGWERMSLAGATDTMRTFGGEVRVDTRLDPVFPRNAIYAAASYERLVFGSGGSAGRTRVEGRGYLGLLGQAVLEAGAVRQSSNRPLPVVLKPLLGGWSSLRGYRAGAFMGDTVLSGSTELRIPLNSPLRLGRVGVSVFVDAGAAHVLPERLQRQRVRTGVGGSVWFSATVLRLSIAVARGLGAGTRVNFAGGLSF